MHPSIVLKVDVDTYRGTCDGAVRLAKLLERNGCNATFLFSVGPDHTGRAVRRVLRTDFLRKVRRTSVTRHYGLRTLMYGTLLPGPDIGRRAREPMRAIARSGFEIGLHAHDHVRWQDGVARAGRDWARRELQKGFAAYAEIFGSTPTVHGAAGWQINMYVPELERELGIRVASDTRGRSPFLPVIAGMAVPVPQVPTTLPTLDELLGREDLQPADPVEHLLSLTRTGSQDHVYTLHAEIEGGACIDQFQSLIDGWRTQGYGFATLSQLAERQPEQQLPRCEIVTGRIPGRSGSLALQGLPRSPQDFGRHGTTTRPLAMHS